MPLQPHQQARQKIIDDFNLTLSLEEIQLLEMTLSWLFNKGVAKAITEIGE